METSGGNENILCALQIYKDRERFPCPLPRLLISSPSAYLIKHSVMKTYVEWRYCITLSLLISALVRGEWSASRLGLFTPGERALDIIGIGYWLGPRHCLDAMQKRKILPLPGIESRPCSPPLYLLSYGFVPVTSGIAPVPLDGLSCGFVCGSESNENYSHFVGSRHGLLSCNAVQFGETAAFGRTYRLRPEGGILKPSKLSLPPVSRGFLLSLLSNSEDDKGKGIRVRGRGGRRGSHIF
jgi:hypothetical protein